jgi:electron transfer flavoprotein alpha subunit
VYLAFGISGALQHLAGMRASKKIVAINIDPEAPLCRIADLVVEGDAVEVCDALLAHLDAS